MKKIIEKKINEVNLLAEKFKKAKTVIAFDYQGLTVSDLTELRKNLHKENCEISILKNNISRRASEQLGFKNFSKDLKGPKAIAISYENVVIAAKELSELAKKNDRVKIYSGIVEGVEVNNEYLTKLANIPPRQELLTILALGMLQPLRNLAVGINMLKEQKQ